MTETGRNPRRWGAAALQRARQLSDETTTRGAAASPTPQTPAPKPRKANRYRAPIAIAVGICCGGTIGILGMKELQSPTLQVLALETRRQHQPGFQRDLRAHATAFLEQRVVDTDCPAQHAALEASLPTYLSDLSGVVAKDFALLCGRDGWAAVIHRPAGIIDDAIIAVVDVEGRAFDAWGAIPIDGQADLSAAFIHRR
ncbi:MAG: hypothetical protein AAFV53_20030 [Myxococcota bacterium]